jgi:hypothetical protein
MEQEVEKCPEAQPWMTHPGGSRAADGAGFRADHRLIIHRLIIG